MSSGGLGSAQFRERPRARRRRRGLRAATRLLLWLSAFGLVFFAGLAIGMAVEDAPQPGGTQTVVRTLEPLTVEPQERTVTVTTAP